LNTTLGQAPGRDDKTPRKLSINETGIPG